MKLLNTAERAARVHNANTHRHFNMNLNEFSIMVSHRIIWNPRKERMRRRDRIREILIKEDNVTTHQ